MGSKFFLPFLSMREKNVFLVLSVGYLHTTQEHLGYHGLLDSRGSFSDVVTPIMFLKKTMFPKTYRSFSGAISKAISIDKKPHTVATIMKTLRSTVMDRFPICAHQAKMLKSSKHKNRMGCRGENCMAFTEELLFDLQQSGRNGLTTNHFGYLLWLKDLGTSNRDLNELGGQIHAA